MTPKRVAALLLAIDFEAALGQNLFNQQTTTTGAPTTTAAATTSNLFQAKVNKTTTMTPFDSSGSSGSGTSLASSMPGYLNTAKSSTSDSLRSGRSSGFKASGSYGSYLQLWQWFLFGGLLCCCVGILTSVFCLNPGSKRPAKQKKRALPPPAPEPVKTSEPVMKTPSDSLLQMPVLPAIPPLMPTVYASPVEMPMPSGSFTSVMPGMEYPTSSYAMPLAPTTYAPTTYNNPLQDYTSTAVTYSTPILSPQGYGYGASPVPAYPATPGYGYPSTAAYASNGSFASNTTPGYPSTPAYPATPAFPSTGGSYGAPPPYNYPLTGYPTSAGAGFR